MVPNNTEQKFQVYFSTIWNCKYLQYYQQCMTSIVMVSAQYGANTFVSVWYHRNTDSGNFEKNFSA
jgi:hypothetical protein